MEDENLLPALRHLGDHRQLLSLDRTPVVIYGTAKALPAGLSSGLPPGRVGSRTLRAFDYQSPRNLLADISNYVLRASLGGLTITSSRSSSDGRTFPL